MVGGSFLALVFVLFLVFQVDVSAKGFLILVNFQYGDCHSSQTPQTQEGCCTQSLASPSTGYHQTIQGETFEHFCNSPGASFARSGFPSQAGHSNVGLVEGENETNAGTSTASKLTETMQGLAASLQNLHKEAETLVEEDAHVAKRPRTALRPEDHDMPQVPGDGSSHFGKAG